MNAKHISNDGQADDLISPQDIAARAYDIYEREGRIDGRDFDHWVRAESELRAERTRGKTPSAQVTAPAPNGDGAGSAPAPDQSRGKAPKRATRPIAAAARN